MIPQYRRALKNQLLNRIKKGLEPYARLSIRQIPAMTERRMIRAFLSLYYKRIALQLSSRKLGAKRIKKLVRVSTNQLLGYTIFISYTDTDGFKPPL